MTAGRVIRVCEGRGEGRSLTLFAGPGVEDSVQKRVFCFFNL